MIKKSLFHLFATALFTVSAFAQTTIVTDDFEGGSFSPDWDALDSATIIAGTGAEGSANFVNIPGGAGPFGAAFDSPASDFFLDFYFRVQDAGTNRQFSLNVSTGTAISVGGATINLRHQGGAWGAFSAGAWQPITLPTVTIDDWYHIRVTANEWGTPTANYDLELSDANGTAFTSSAVGISFFHGGNPTTTGANAFNFNANFGNNPGYDLDNVTVETIAIPIDDPDLSVSLANPFAATPLTINDDPVTAVITLENIGTTNPLTIAETSTLSGDDAASYTILTPLPLEITPGASAPLEIQIEPSGIPGILNANLEIASNDASSPITTIPLSARIIGADRNQLFNGDFEADPTSLLNWFSQEVTLSEGIAPGSTTSASLASSALLRQSVFGEADWHLELFFQAPDTADRAFNLLIESPQGYMNLRFQGTSAGADQTWNAFDNVTNNDSWGDALALPAVQPGATYFLRVMGKAWDGLAPTYDLELSAPNSTTIAGTATDLNRFQTAIPGGAPTEIRISSLFGDSPGFVVDDLVFRNGNPVTRDPAITSISHDPSAQTTTLTLTTQIGIAYAVEASNDLENWDKIEDFTAIAASQIVTESGVTASPRYYRFFIVQ